MATRYDFDKDGDEEYGDEALLRTALENFDSAVTAYASQRQSAREDLSFVAGNQYDNAVPGDDDYRLTVNLLGPFLRQITAEARSANPSIKVVPVSDQGDVDTADIIGGLIRHIEQKSNFETVYQQALWYAAASGEGYIYLDSEYCDPDSFDQELIIKECDNPEKVFIDPNHKEKDGSDAEWGFIIEDLDHGTFSRKFPDSKLTEAIGDNQWQRLALPNDWINQKTVRVAKYWLKEYTKKKVWLVMDPVTQKQYSVTEKPGDDVVLMRKDPRVSYEVKVCSYMLTCNEILEESYWPGKYIPIIKVVGETFAVGGQKVQYGAIRMAKDPQRQYNYAVSRQTEMIDQAPKNSFVITEKQLGNHAEKWANANRVNYGALPYVKEEGSMPPTRVSGLDGNSFQAVAAARTQSLEDIKLVFGLNDASLGRPGNETSGVGIEARVEQSSRSTYQYFDHLLLSLKCLGRQIIEVLPVFYDTERTIRIVKPTTEEELVKINSMDNNNKYDLTVGKYDVIISTGPAYASKRQEAYEALNGIMQVIPGAPIGDLVAGQVDSPIAKIAAARIKATIPPEILAATGEDDTEDMAPKELVTQLQQKLAQASMQMQKMDLENQELQTKLVQAVDKAALELTKADMEDDQKKQQLQLDRETAKAEYELKMLEIELKREELALARDQMALNATVAAGNLVDKDLDREMKQVKVPKTNIDENIGGEI